MPSFRTLVFWTHLVVALLAGVVVLIMSVTGVALTYERQIGWWADTRGMEIAALPGVERLPTETIAALAAGTVGEEPSSITWRSDLDAPASVSFGRGHTVLVDPYTGAVLGEGSARADAILGGLRNWHRWLAQTGESRTWGRAVTGASNLGFLFLVISGFFLWWPRNWNLRALRNVLFFRRGLTPKARDFNWHNTIGFWSALPLAIVVASATVISYPWASDLAYRVVGDTPPVRGGGPAVDAEPEIVPVVASRAELATLDEVAERQVEGWRSISRSVGDNESPEVSFSIDAGSGGQPQHRSQLVLSAADGSVVRWEPFSSQSPGRRFRSILRFAHTGEVAGIPGQTLAGLVSLAGVFLVWTGFALTLRRFAAWRRRRPKAPSSVGEARKEEEFAGIR